MSKLSKFAAISVLTTAFGPVQAMNHDLSYNIRLTKDTGGLNIVVRTAAGQAVAVGLENLSGKPALCTASFVSYPHNPGPDETSSATVAPGKKVTLSYPAWKLGIFSTAFVDVKCTEKK